MKFSASKNSAWLIIFAFSFTSCHEDWLEVKRNRQQIVPTTLEDLKLLLTDELTVATDFIALMQISADDYYLNSDRYNALTNPIEKNAYLWKKDIYEQQQSISDWDNSYNQVLTANVVLDGLERIDIDSKNSSDWNHVKGAALYLRAKAFYNISQVFAKPYDPLTSHSDLGIPLRITSDLNAATTRSSVKQTYDRIQEDLKQAISSLPSSTAFKTDPSKTSAYGLLARCYLSMGEYTPAELYADSALTQYDALIDYSTVNTGALIPFTRFNTETIQFAQISPLYSVFIFLRQNYVPAELYNSYDDNDLRKVLFFHKISEGNYSFKGSYDGGATPFTGIATDELFLIRAECRARAGNIEGAMQDLNTLLVTRYKTGTFVPTTATSVSEAMDLILDERRKELIGRGLRWSDLRRLNKEPEYAITIVRTIDGTEYSLEPNDSRYVFAIPEYVINKTGIPQNVR